MLSCMRKFPYAHNQLKVDRVWKREDWYGNELYGKKTRSNWFWKYRS